MVILRELPFVPLPFVWRATASGLGCAEGLIALEFDLLDGGVDGVFGDLLDSVLF